MEIKKNNRLSWGVTLIVFGVLFLIKKLFLLPEAVTEVIFDFRNYPIYAGVVFLIFSKNKNTGFVLLAIGLILRLSQIIYFVSNVSDVIWPAVLIVVGVLLVYQVTKKND